MESNPVRVVVFAPFLSGIVLDAEQAVASDEGARRWRSLFAERTGDLGWRQPHAAFELQGYSDVLEERVRAFVPQLVTERTVAPAPEPLPPLGVATSAAIAFSAYGVGLLTVTYEGRRAEIDAASFADSMRADEHRQALDGAYASAIQRSIVDLRALAEEVKCVDPYEHVLDDGQSTGLLWTHHLLVVHGAGQSVESIAARLAPDGLRCVVSGTQVVFGVGRSVAGCAPGASSAADTVERVVALETVHWAAAARLDLLLIRRLGLVSPSLGTHSLKRIDQAAHELLVLFQHVRFFRATSAGLGSYVVPDDYTVWDALRGHWDLEGKLEAVDAKLESLQRLEETIRAWATATRERILNTAAFIFAVASGAVAVFSFADFLGSKDPFSSPRAWRLAITVAVAALTAAGVAWALFARPARRRR